MTASGSAPLPPAAVRRANPVSGLVYVSETQKCIARVHQIPPHFLEKLLHQFSVCQVEREGLIAERETAEVNDKINAELPWFTAIDYHRMDHGPMDNRSGITFDLWVHKSSLTPGQVLFENKTPTGAGFELYIDKKGALVLLLDDGLTACLHPCEKAALEGAPEWTHIGVVIDGGPKIVSFVVNGRFCDGGSERQFGWSRFSPQLRDVKGSGMIQCHVPLKSLKIYNRALMTSELIGNYRAEQNL